jgi:hypothetical protein
VPASETEYARARNGEFIGLMFIEQVDDDFLARHSSEGSTLYKL